jgi:TrmH family RNA methyltransferase
VITSKDNTTLKTMRKLQRDKKFRAREGLFVAEGEDLVDAARANGWLPEVVLEAGVDVEPDLLHAVSALGSGSRVMAIFRERWSRPAGQLSVYLHGVGDPGNVGTIIRSAHALADGPVVLGPGCADPYSPKAVRASMGSLFARPPARVTSFDEIPGTTIALERGAGDPLGEVQAEAPVTLCLGAERTGLPREVANAATAVAHIPLRPDGPDSLNVAMAATVALYERNRMAGRE